MFASNLVHDFFGVDSNLMTARDRRNRRDFNTQISVPIAQLLLDLLRRHRPSRIYTYDEIFGEMPPSTYLLEAFERHFGFKLQELEWRYDPDRVASDIRAVLEPLMRQLAVVLYAYHCDILVLAGRPTSLDTITELFVKYYPLSPDRLIRLGDYHVGTWYPFSDGQGYFFDQKSVVAVGGMVGHTASHTGFNGLVIDFSRMTTEMRPTAHYLGLFDPATQQVKETLLSPEKSTVILNLYTFPAFIGCKQIEGRTYQPGRSMVSTTTQATQRSDSASRETITKTASALNWKKSLTPPATTCPRRPCASCHSRWPTTVNTGSTRASLNCLLNNGVNKKTSLRVKKSTICFRR